MRKYLRDSSQRIINFLTKVKCALGTSSQHEELERDGDLGLGRINRVIRGEVKEKKERDCESSPSPLPSR